jgi:hypothetical protein
MNRFAVALFAVVFAPAAHAGAIEDVMRMQKNGLWELKPPGHAGAPLQFCVTDTTKIGGLRETQDAVKSLGCRTERDALKGDQYEIALNCSSPQPEVGNFRMVMTGSARPDFQSGKTTVTGGGRMIQMLFPSGKEGGGENRWVRPCKPDEKPGLQEKK